MTILGARRICFPQSVARARPSIGLWMPAVALVLMAAAAGCEPTPPSTASTHGDRALGAACTRSDECATGVCNISGACAPNECPAGGCVDGRVCGTDSCGTRCFVPPGPGDRCEESIDGVPCNGFETECRAGMNCAVYPTDNGQTFGVCVAPRTAELGRFCVDDGDCVAGLFCRVPASLAAGFCEECDDGEHPCDSGLSCLNACVESLEIPVRSCGTLSQTGDVCRGSCPSGIEISNPCAGGVGCTAPCAGQPSETRIACCE